jgi:hypothetical protein
VGGGDLITITGTNFEGGVPNAVVLLGTQRCLEVNVVSASQIKCVTPPMPEGTVDVTVRNGGASAGITLSPCAGCLTAKDIRGPKITEGFPQQASAVSVHHSAKAGFNEDLDPRTVAPTSFHIAGVTGDTFCSSECDTPCAGASAVRTICFKPSQPLQAGTNFTVVATDAITDSKGNKLQGVDATGQLRWTFRTCAENEPCPE